MATQMIVLVQNLTVQIQRREWDSIEAAINELEGGWGYEMIPEAELKELGC